MWSVHIEYVCVGGSCTIHHKAFPHTWPNYTPTLPPQPHEHTQTHIHTYHTRSHTHTHTHIYSNRYTDSHRKSTVHTVTRTKRKRGYGKINKHVRSLTSKREPTFTSLILKKVLRKLHVNVANMGPIATPLFPPSWPFNYK